MRGSSVLAVASHKALQERPLLPVQMPSLLPKQGYSTGEQGSSCVNYRLNRVELLQLTGAKGVAVHPSPEQRYDAQEDQCKYTR